MSGAYIPRLGGKQIADAARKEKECSIERRTDNDAVRLAKEYNNEQDRQRVEAVLANSLYLQHSDDWYIHQLERLRSDLHATLSDASRVILKRIERKLAQGYQVAGARWKPERVGEHFRKVAPDWMLDPSKLPKKPPKAQT